MTLTDCVSTWIKRREITLAASTISGYRCITRKYIATSAAGAVEVGDLDEDDMIELLRPLIVADHTRQAQILQVLVSAVLRDQVRHRVILVNPMDFVDRIKHRSAITAWLTVEQARELLTVSRREGDPYYIAWLLMICCGLRRGEMLGLQWGDIDLDRGSMMITRQRLQVDGVMLETRPKSLSSIREIPLDEMIITELRLMRKSGRYILEGVTPFMLASALDTAINRAGVPRVTPHGLRHTMAATAASEGVPLKALQSLMGHAHMQTTADIYAHVDQTARISAGRLICCACLPARLEIV